MLKTYKKFDAWLIHHFQGAYLWLLDRTGIYVGTVIFLNGTLVILHLIQQNSMWLAAFIMVAILLISLPRYLLQGAEKYETFNQVAAFEEGMSGRHLFLILNLICLALPPYSMLDVLNNVSQQVMWYLLCLKIRERDRKPFFERQRQLELQ